MNNLLHAILLILSLFPGAQASSYHVPLIISPAPLYSRRRCSRRHSVLLASSSTRKSPSSLDKSQRLVNPTLPKRAEEPDIPPWEDLPLHWKVIFGGVEVAYVVGSQWLSGFVMAYVFGGISGVYGLTKPPTEGLTRFSRWNQRNVRWGKSWGTISAAFSGFDTSVKLLRNNRVDEWNSLIGSAFAGAFFVRKQGPEAMLRSAVMYAAFGYFFLRMSSSGQRNLTVIEEREI